ncbi:MAG: response regulator [Proteobacteria bacterium]|jgi:signal transduction histidine kinase|nr:response regulator [Pseudomonadota bacterium]
MTATQHLQATHILIVDDSPANLLLLARMLGEKGYRTLTASSGKLALEAARADPPDLILLDITMPEMNGYETCEQIKADTTLRDIPVIFISSLNETIDKVKAFGVGGVDYVTKPFQFEEVYARVQTHLQLRRLGRLRDSLTHMVVHDLRNPLTVICDFLDILEFQKAQVLSATTQALVTVARRSAEDLLTMIGSILDVAKMGAGEMSLQREPCDLGALVRALLDTIHPLPDNRTVTLEAKKPSLFAPVDAGLIRRVLQNLLGNALKYTPVGGDVRVVLTPSRGEIRIEVIDLGPGIAPEYHQRIFEKYGQVEDRTNRVGTGLGLAFCKLAVEAHGGRIGVESEVGKGSTFWMTLPRPEDGVGAS